MSTPLSLELLAPFALVLLVSIGIIVYAARRTRTVSDFLVAGNRISATQNALALAGDFVGVGGFFAITGLIGVFGADGYVLAIGAICGFPFMLFLFAEPLRRLGRYTISDVLCTKLQDERLRTATAVTQLVAVLAQLVAQLVGAAALLHLLFGFSYEVSLSVMAAIIVSYVMLGGMLATTWLQIVKACLMIAIAALIAVLSLQRFGFDPLSLLDAAVAARGPDILVPGRLFASPFDTASLLLGIALGNACMPHILMRVNTVTDPVAARQSVFVGTSIIIAFHLIVLILGFSALVLIGAPAIRAADPGGNMALPLLAQAVGGDAMLGAVSAVALATILAVVSGLVMAGAASLAHDIWARGNRGGLSPARQLWTSRVATVLIVAGAVALTFLFRGQNVGFLSAMGYSIAASANFPVLLLTLFWRGQTPAGALAGMVGGLVTSVVLILLSPAVYVSVFHFPAALFPLQNPALVGVPAGFLINFLVSRHSTARSVAAGRLAMARPRQE